MGAVLSRLTPPSWLRLPRRTARIRLTALYGGLFLLSGSALVAITYGLFQRATEYRTPPLPEVPKTPAIQALPQLAKVQLGLAQDQFQLQGLPVAISGPNQNPFTGPVRAQLAQVENQLVQDQHQLAQAQHRLAQSVHQLAQAGTVQAAQRAADAHQLLVNSGVALGIVAVLAILAGWLVAGRMLRPIRIITRTARRISSASLHERLALDGPQDELKELGDTLDSLFARLEAAFEAQRHFVANASHELRTPLTAERTLLQVALDDPRTTAAAWRCTAREVLASSDEQARLIEALLTLASSESGLSERESVDLATTVSSTLVSLRPEFDRLGTSVDVVTTPASLDGDPLLVERLVANLLANAVHHNIAGGRVQVATGISEGRAILSVTNTGPFIPPAEVERLFQPFRRLDPRRAAYKNGHGLGLSIVRAIATAHDASISAKAEPTGGPSVTVVFPEPGSVSRSSRLRDQQPVSHARRRAPLPLALTGTRRAR